MLRKLLIGALGLCILAGCSDDSCVDNAGIYCDEGAAYWLNSCGDMGGLKEMCECGCRTDHTDCKACECVCEQVGACCDGCRATNQADECDDGDPATEIDICAGGECMGFGLQRPAPDLPAEPAAPAPVHLESWTCPAGWNAVEHATLTDAAGDPFSWCEPPDIPSVPRLKLGTYVTPLSPGEQDGDRPVCEPEVDGTFPVYGHEDCQPLGDPCPAGDWPDIPAGTPGARVYVLAGSVGGDGSQGAPFGTIAEGVSLAASEDVVVIGAGVYPEMVAVNKNLTLWGKCVQQTVIDAPGPYVQYSDGAVMVDGLALLTIRNLRISGEQNGVRLNSRNADVRLEGVWIHEATREGVSQSVSGGRVRMTGVLIDSMQALSDGSMGWGIGTREDCNVTVESSTIELARDVGVWSVANTIHLEDALVRNTLSREAGGTAGRGVELQTGASMTALRALFDHNRDFGLAVMEGSSADLDEVVIFDTQSQQTSNESGAGIIVVQQDSSVTLKRSQVVRNREAGILVTGAGAELILEDVVINDTQPVARSGVYGNGIWADSGVTITADRVILDGNKNAGVIAVSSGTSADLNNVIVCNTVDDAQDHPEHIGDGEGIWVEQGAGITLTDSLLEGNHGTGAVARFANSILTLQNTAVLDTRSRVFDGQRGYCLDATDGGRIEATGGLFAGCQGIGITATAPGSELVMQDVTVRDTQSEESSGSNGVGLMAGDGALVTVTRGSFERNRTIGIYIIDPLTAAEFTDVSVSGTLPNEAENMLGHGMEVGTGAQVTITRGMFEANRGAGFGAASPGTLCQLQDITVKNTASWPTVQVDAPESGLFAGAGARVVVTGGLLEGNRASGILAIDAGTTVELDAVTVQDTLSQEGLQVRGVGVWADGGAWVKCTNCLFERNREVGVFAQSPGTRLEFEYVVVRDTLPQDRLGEYGHGVNIQMGATMSLHQSVLDGNRVVGANVLNEGSVLDLEEVLIANTRGREFDRIYGRGLCVQDQAAAVVRSSVFWKNRDISISVHDPGSELYLQQSLILEGLVQECADVEPLTCEGEGRGSGLGVYTTSTAFVDGVGVLSSRQAGIQLAELGTITGTNVIVRDNPIGVNIQDVPADYDFFEAVTHLEMEDNGINFDSATLSVPDPVVNVGD